MDRKWPPPCLERLKKIIRICGWRMIYEELLDFSAPVILMTLFFDEKGFQGINQFLILRGELKNWKGFGWRYFSNVSNIKSRIYKGELIVWVLKYLLVDFTFRKSHAGVSSPTGTWVWPLTWSNPWWRTCQVFVVVVDTPVGVIVTMSFLCRHRHSIYYNVPRVPCPDGKFLLSPVVRHYMRTWSDCTRKMIDAEFKRREDKGENCFFTWPMSSLMILNNENGQQS